jgi:hypothetical protein
LQYCEIIDEVKLLLDAGAEPEQSNLLPPWIVQLYDSRQAARAAIYALLIAAKRRGDLRGLVARELWQWSKKMKLHTGAKDWCDALLAHDDEPLRWMAADRKARAVVNDSFLSPKDVHSPLTWAIAEGAIPLERIQFLVERAGARATSTALQWAVELEKWQLADYLYGKGAAYVMSDTLARRLGALQLDGKGKEPELLELLLQHSHLWEYLRIYRGVADWIILAMHRKQATQDACLAILGVQKRRSPTEMSKDVAKLITKRVWKQRTVAKWGEPSFATKVKHKPCVAFSFLLSLILCLVILLVVGVNLYTISPPPRTEYAMILEDYTGPIGPKGFEQNPIIDNNRQKTWTVPGKCFSFPPPSEDH